MESRFAIWDSDEEQDDEGQPKETRVVLHGIAADFMEFEEGPAGFPVAVIELPDGRLRSVYVEKIRMDPPSASMKAGD